MQVFVKGLRGAETLRIAQAYIDIFGGIVAKVDTRAENKILHQVVLVETRTYEEAPTIVFPLVLEIGTTDMHFLVDVSIITRSIVREGIVVIFYTTGHLGRHKEQVVEAMHILHTRNQRKIIGIAIGIEVFAGTIIAVATGVLHRYKGVYLILAIGRIVVVVDATTIDDMLGLLGNHSLMRGQMHTIATTTFLVDTMIFEGKF